nr:hypothetical protein [uncultured Desulfobulbus sp.]
MKTMSVLPLAMATLLCATSPVLSDNYSWDTQKGPDGSWFDADHWSPPDGYPNGRDDGASIDSDFSVLSTVTYPAYQGNCNVNSIQVCANQVSLSNPDGDPDRLNIYGFLGLLASTSDAPPRLVNDGIVFLDGTLHFEEAASEDQYGQILGAGVIQLGANGTLNGTFINGPDQVIEGKGRIGFEGAGQATFRRPVTRSADMAV